MLTSLPTTAPDRNILNILVSYTHSPVFIWKALMRNTLSSCSFLSFTQLYPQQRSATFLFAIKQQIDTKQASCIQTLAILV